MPHGCEAPDTNGKRVPDASSDAIDYAAHKHESNGIGSIETGNDIRVLNLVPAEDPLQVWREESEYLAIHVVDGGSEEKQCADQPAKVSAGAGVNGGVDGRGTRGASSLIDAR